MTSYCLFTADVIAVISHSDHTVPGPHTVYHRSVSHCVQWTQQVTECSTAHHLECATRRMSSDVHPELQCSHPAYSNKKAAKHTRNFNVSQRLYCWHLNGFSVISPVAFLAVLTMYPLISSKFE